MSGTTSTSAEESRLAAVRSLGLVDTPPEERFDRITRLVQACFDAPVALMTLVERERQFFKSHQGTALSGLLREGSFCEEVLRGDDVIVVEDAASDPRFRHHVLVAGPAGMRFYAGHPIRTHDGQAVGTLCILDARPRTLDAAERSRLASFARLIETELHRDHLERTRTQSGTVEHELRRFFSLSLDMLCVAGHDGYFKELNPAWESTLGWSRDELLARPYLDFVHREDRARTLQEARLLERGDITVAFENRYRCPDGTYRNLLWSAVADPGGGRVFAVARDITALRASEEALRRSRAITEAAGRARGRLLAGLGSELQGPAGRVLDSARSLAEAADLGERPRSLLERIQQDSLSLLATVGDLHELANIDSGQVRPERENVDLVSLVETVCASTEPLAQRNGCALRAELPERRATLQTDGRRLEQALRRIVEVATRSALRGQVIVRVLVDPEVGAPTRIVVEESAASLAHESREPSPAATDSGAMLLGSPEAGGGLGLAIARSLCELLGHRLQLTSRAGIGSTYLLDLAAAG